MTIVDLIRGSELQLSPLPELKAEFEKITDQFFTDLEKKQEAGPIKDLIKKYEGSCHDFASKYKKKIEERQKNVEAAVKSLQIEAKSKVDEKKNKDEEKDKDKDKENKEEKAPEPKKLAQTISEEAEDEEFTDLSQVLIDDDDEAGDLSEIESEQ